jgi:hypothetical protein
VKNPEKWLRNEEWKTEPLTARPALSVEKMPVEYFIESYKKTGRWSPQSGYSDISQVDPAVLAEHGLMPDGRKAPPGWSYAEYAVESVEKMVALRGTQ